MYVNCLMLCTLTEEPTVGENASLFLQYFLQWNLDFSKEYKNLFNFKQGNKFWFKLSGGLKKIEVQEIESQVCNACIGLTLLEAQLCLKLYLA